MRQIYLAHSAYYRYIKYKEEHVARVKLYNKKYNVTYVYDSVSYWDPELKQPRSKRKLIGKIDPDTGEIIPTSPRGKRARDKNQSRSAASGPVKNAVPTESETMSNDAISVELEDYKRRLLEVEAKLARSESQIAVLNAERKEIREELAALVKKLR
jgi:hypothetical protein